MPFLKPILSFPTKEKSEKAKRNGWRSSIFSVHEIQKSSYKGEWKNDKRDGLGFEHVRNKYVYKGYWKDGKRHGHGVLTSFSATGSPIVLYSGEWYEGKQHGLGSRHYTNNNFYKGEFLRNKRHGFGCMWYNDCSFYKGTWKNNLFHGKGVFTDTNKNVYDGEFVDGKKEGKGIFYHMNTGQIQEGIWKDNGCVMSEIVDTYFRPCAEKMTPFPIPKIDVEIEYLLNFCKCSPCHKA